MVGVEVTDSFATNVAIVGVTVGVVGTITFAISFMGIFLSETIKKHFIKKKKRRKLRSRRTRTKVRYLN